MRFVAKQIRARLKTGLKQSSMTTELSRERIITILSLTEVSSGLRQMRCVARQIWTGLVTGLRHSIRMKILS